MNELSARERAALEHLHGGMQYVSTDNGQSWQESYRSTEAIRLAAEVALREHPADGPSELEKLQAEVRKHRDQRGDDRCWMDDEELYKALPEGYTPPERDTLVEIALCRKFIENRHNPTTEYVSPQRRIEELEAEIADCRKLNAE